MGAGCRGGGGGGPIPIPAWTPFAHPHTQTEEGATWQQGTCGSPSMGHPVLCTQGGDGVGMGVAPSPHPVHWQCHGYVGKVLDSAVMTTQAESILVMDYS
jgi:hypothetical protein